MKVIPVSFTDHYPTHECRITLNGIFFFFSYYSFLFLGGNYLRLARGFDLNGVGAAT